MALGLPTHEILLVDALTLGEAARLLGGTERAELGLLLGPDREHFDLEGHFLAR